MARSVAALFEGTPSAGQLIGYSLGVLFDHERIKYNERARGKKCVYSVRLNMVRASYLLPLKLRSGGGNNGTKLFRTE